MSPQPRNQDRHVPGARVMCFCTTEAIGAVREVNGVVFGWEGRALQVVQCVVQ